MTATTNWFFECVHMRVRVCVRARVCVRGGAKMPRWERRVDVPHGALPRQGRLPSLRL